MNEFETGCWIYIIFYINKYKLLFFVIMQKCQKLFISALQWRKMSSLNQIFSKKTPTSKACAHREINL